MDRKTGLAPVVNGDSRVLILGSFPSVKSRETDFYYGNRQNRFWGLICGFFGEAIPATKEGKIAFLHRRKIALWDMVVSCEVEGSSDASVKNEEIADLDEIFCAAKIEKILLNGTLAYTLFVKDYANTPIPYVKMPSTSPANPRFSKEVWEKELQELRQAVTRE